MLRAANYIYSFLIQETCYLLKASEGMLSVVIRFLSQMGVGFR